MGDDARRRLVYAVVSERVKQHSASVQVFADGDARTSAEDLIGHWQPHSILHAAADALVVLDQAVSDRHEVEALDVDRSAGRRDTGERAGTGERPTKVPVHAAALALSGCSSSKKSFSPFSVTW